MDGCGFRDAFCGQKIVVVAGFLNGIRLRDGLIGSSGAANPSDAGPSVLVKFYLGVVYLTPDAMTSSCAARSRPRRAGASSCGVVCVSDAGIGGGRPVQAGALGRVLLHHEQRRLCYPAWVRPVPARR